MFLAGRTVSSQPVTRINTNYIMKPHPALERWGGLGSQGFSPRGLQAPPEPQFAHPHIESHTRPSAYTSSDGEAASHPTSMSSDNAHRSWSLSGAQQLSGSAQSNTPG